MGTALHLGSWTLFLVVKPLAGRDHRVNTMSALLGNLGGDDRLLSGSFMTSIGSPETTSPARPSDRRPPSSDLRRGATTSGRSAAFSDGNACSVGTLLAANFVRQTPLASTTSNTSCSSSEFPSPKKALLLGSASPAPTPESPTDNLSLISLCPAMRSSTRPWPSQTPTKAPLPRCSKRTRCSLGRVEHSRRRQLLRLFRHPSNLMNLDEMAKSRAPVTRRGRSLRCVQDERLAEGRQEDNQRHCRRRNGHGQVLFFLRTPSHPARGHVHGEREGHPLLHAQDTSQQCLLLRVFGIEWICFTERTSTAPRVCAGCRGRGVQAGARGTALGQVHHTIEANLHEGHEFGRALTPLVVQKINPVEQAISATRIAVGHIESSHHNDRIERWLRLPNPSTNANHARKLWPERTFAGCGKTVLSTTVLDHIAADKDRLLISFFFDFSDKTKQAVDSMLRLLAFQLYQSGAGSSITDASYQAHQDGFQQPATKTLKGTLVRSTSQSKRTSDRTWKSITCTWQR
ncbi:hypothetical protein B0T11DRAFT_28783 [Plectosphaerella cucumerina]|uniref:Nephrocystin 3-like N-terminal domain-containing protein n=1 Tax=Plectosphaerella cucumerina TaxID=40658 RepID=A0A8K0X9N2_9PEZI|nr:hypothetical protein B0T11DRAFT_28783 [Plectosphaerella cucumerina]